MRINKEFFVERLNTLDLYVYILHRNQGLTIKQEIDFELILTESKSIGKFLYDPNINAVLDKISFLGEYYLYDYDKFTDKKHTEEIRDYIKEAKEKLNRYNSF